VACGSRTLLHDVVHADLRRILPPEVFTRAVQVLRATGVDDAFTAGPNQGLTLVHFLAQRKRFLWDWGCV